MDAGNMGYGAGGGVLTAVLTWMGFKQRLDRLDRDIDDLKNDGADLKKVVVFKDTCGVCHTSTVRAVDKLDAKLDLILEKLK
jgi:hypothetical protein